VCVCASGIGFAKDNCVKHLARMVTYVVSILVLILVVILVDVDVLGTLATFTRRSNFKQQTTSFPLIFRCQALLLSLPLRHIDTLLSYLTPLDTWHPSQAGWQVSHNHFHCQHFATHDKLTKNVKNSMSPTFTPLFTTPL